ncbi:MAG: hypothetical protein GXZ06_10175 [Tissierellia bacterium]|nr:hypothetical protein [Tissierellia bacterium]
MKAAFSIFEKLIIVLLIISFSFLLVVQLTNYRNDFSVSTSLFDEDNFSYLLKGEGLSKGIIVLKNLDYNYKDVSILVNGEYVANFSESNEVKIPVYNNDIVEIDGTKYNNKVKIKVIGISKNISSPQLNKIVTTSQSIEILGRVQIK